MEPGLARDPGFRKHSAPTIPTHHSDHTIPTTGGPTPVPAAVQSRTAVIQMSTQTPSQHLNGAVFFVYTRMVARPPLRPPYHPSELLTPFFPSSPPCCGARGVGVGAGCDRSTSSPSLKPGSRRMARGSSCCWADGASTGTRSLAAKSTSGTAPGQSQSARSPFLNPFLFSMHSMGSCPDANPRCRQQRL